ncbi:lactosylceramide 4-alpha-galactosyltransferase-like [Haemaphysalis longicornis]
MALRRFSAPKLLVILTIVKWVSVPGSRNLADKYEEPFHVLGKNIFLLETSARTNIDSRVACAIESAARQNPEWTVFYLSLEDTSSRYMDELTSTLPNIQHQRSSLMEIFNGTVMFNWYLSGIWTTSPYKVMHLSDALRLALLWKYGGAYVDLDVVVLGSFDDVRNSVCRELFPDVGNAVMTFDKGHPFLLHCMQEFAASYRSMDYPYNGPRLLDRVLCELCTEEVFYNEENFECAGVHVLESKAFFPVSYPEWHRPFYAEDADEVLNDCKNSTVIHLWNSLSHAAMIEPGSAYDTWRRVLCPTTSDAAPYIGADIV